MKICKLFLLLTIILTACGEKVEETPTQKFCRRIEETFSTPGDSWEKYKNGSISWLNELINQVPEDKKDEAYKQLEDKKKKLENFPKKKRINELRNFCSELANGSFGCSSRVAEIVKNHVESQYPNIFTNYDYCSNSDLVWYFLAGLNVPSKCLLEIKPYETRVIQQLPDGILASFSDPSGFSNAIFFISKNQKDAELVDNVPIPGGIFVREGTYSYNNVFGAPKTVIKLKRIE